jgi:hypothetical protein
LQGEPGLVGLIGGKGEPVSMSLYLLIV